MDANGLRFWQAADAKAFGIDGDADNLHWRAEERLLRLDLQQSEPGLNEASSDSLSIANAPSPVADKGDSFAWWDGAAGTLRTAGFGEGAVPLPIAPDIPVGVPQPTDLALGDDDVLYIARNDGVILADRRGRWLNPARVDQPGFSAHRLAPIPGGGVWILDRTSGEIARLTGHPLRDGGIEAIRSERFRPVEPNPKPPKIVRVRGCRLPATVQGKALAGSVGGRLAVLGWVSGEEAQVFTLEGRKLVQRFSLAGIRFPFGIAWVGENRVAVIASDGSSPAKQAFVYELDRPPSDTLRARPTGEVYRLLDPRPANFCNRLAETPSYLIAGADPALPDGVRKLRPLSSLTYARHGRVTIGPFDSGSAGNVWHRLYVEASIPEQAGVCIWAHANDHGGRPDAPGSANAPDWAPHIFGLASVDHIPDAPRASWCVEPSELPFNGGMSRCPPVQGRSGLFTALIQHAGRKVRRLSGRWLWLHLELTGNGLVSPDIAAVRVHGHRFAWRDQYLPEFYRETLAGDDGAASGTATRHDFLDRFLGLFEGPLTQLEDKVAQSWLLTDPAATPDAALDWLGHWIGIDAETAEAPAHRRERLRAAPYTTRLHGTAGGVMAALEIATGGRLILGGRIDPERAVPRPGQMALATLDGAVIRSLVLGVSDPRAGQPNAVLAGGAVTRGEIIVLEGWRLRRTFATILGADLADEEDPLTLGLSNSGNSYVGDSLILGDAAQREVLALFSADLPQSNADRAAVAAFFDRLAYRVLILMRETGRTKERERLLAVAQREVPAHVEVNVVPARQPLIVGASSLVGIDSFLLPEPVSKAVRVNRSRIGLGDRLQGNGQLDARADGPISPRPVAVADGPNNIFEGSDFILSSARSEAARGRAISRSIWTWM